MLAPIRRLRLAWWTFALRLRLRRHGVRLQVAIAPNLRVAGRPHLDVELVGGRTGGTLTLDVGRDVRVGRDLVLDVQPGADHVVEIGSGTVFQDQVRLQLRGGAIRVGEHGSVRDGCQLKSSGDLSVGRRVILSRGSAIHCVARVTLGDLVGLAERVTVVDSDHGADGTGAWFMERPLLVDPVVIEANVFVGANAVVMRGSVLGANSVVAAGSVVSAGEYPAGFLVGGVPARPMRQLGR